MNAVALLPASATPVKNLLASEPQERLIGTVDLSIKALPRDAETELLD